MRNTRLPGHGLFAEGNAFRWAGLDDPSVERHPEKAHTWTGPALCSCGAESPVLESNNARKRWHADHKAAVARELSDGYKVGTGRTKWLRINSGR